MDGRSLPRAYAILGMTERSANGARAGPGRLSVLCDAMSDGPDVLIGFALNSTQTIVGFAS